MGGLAADVTGIGSSIWAGGGIATGTIWMGMGETGRVGVVVLEG